MRLINNMMRDLDARRVHSGAGRLTALPVAGTGTVRPGATRLLAGLVMLMAIAIGTPLITDYLELFDWGGPGGPAVTKAISIPMLVKNQPDRQAGSMQPHTQTTRRQAAVQIPANIPDQSGTAGDPEPAHVPGDSVTHVMEDTAIRTVPPASMQEGDQSTGEIVLRRNGPGHEYRLAAGAAAAGNELEAIDQLKVILAQANDYHQARLLLARLYIRQQQNSHAEILLHDGLASHPLYAPYARLLAHLLVTEGRHDAAIVQLESALPGAMKDADYQALLAGLYQRRDKPMAAVRHYSRALELDPQHGEWWMGLAISQEQAGNINAAYAAYGTALQFRLDATLREYIDKRLRQITQQGSTGMTNMQPTGKV